MMNKRVPRGIAYQRDDDQQFDDMQGHHQYHGYTGHLSNPTMGNVPQYMNQGPNL